MTEERSSTHGLDDGMIKIFDLKRSTTPGVQTVTFKTNDVHELDMMIARMFDKPLQVKFMPQRAKRSLNANNYHYALCGKIAEALGSTADEIHAMLMADYGTPKTNEAGQTLFQLMKEPVGYCKPTGHYENRKDGQYQWYVAIKPSHEYDTAEMARLIDGTVYEAKALGIETMTPEELERMKSTWKGEDK